MTTLLFLCTVIVVVLFQCCHSFRTHLPSGNKLFTLRREITSLEGKKDKKFQDKKAPGAPSKGEKQGQKDRFDALTRQVVQEPFLILPLALLYFHSTLYSTLLFTYLYHTPLQFMFTIQGLTKTLPDGSRTILKNINLCFYPGAKIGVVGLNGSGKSSLLKVDFITPYQSNRPYHRILVHPNLKTMSILSSKSLLRVSFHM